MWKILKKCFLATTYRDACIGSNLQQHSINYGLINCRAACHVKSINVINLIYIFTSLYKFYNSHSRWNRTFKMWFYIAWLILESVLYTHREHFAETIFFAVSSRSVPYEYVFPMSVCSLWVSVLYVFGVPSVFGVPYVVRCVF